VKFKIDEAKPFKLFPCCVSVRGFSRSVIYDLNRSEFCYIPNDLHDLLDRFDGESVRSIKSCLGVHAGARIDEYIRFLVKHEYVWFDDSLDELKRMPPIDTNFSTPAEISNAIFQIENTPNVEIKKMVKDLSMLGCRDILIVFYSKPKLALIKEVLNQFENSSFKSIELLIRFDERLKESELHELVNQYRRIRKLVIYGSPKLRKARDFAFGMNGIVFIPRIITHSLYSSIANTTSFRVNIDFFSEAKNYNPYVNKKVVIDISGNLKNAPNMDEEHGNFNLKPISEVISDDRFRNLWNIKKDEIAVCKDCEYRYMCLDNRIPVKKDGEWQHDTPCLYDVYSGKWAQK